jgi:ankyrin repeat protein
MNLEWSVRSGDGLHLSWLAGESNIAYLVAYKADKDGRFQAYESPPRLRRIDLIAGKWMTDLPIGNRISAEYSLKSVVAVLPYDGGVLVLTGLTKDESKTTWEDVMAAYVVSFFKEGATNPAWSKQFSSTGERPHPGAYLWGIRGPRYASSSISPLSWMGDRLLVCPEGMQPLRCLNPETGSEIWQVDRVWEFQRGFIGPSVWAHYISRFGNRMFDTTTKSPGEERKTFDQSYQCALAGGPVSVRLNFGRGNDSHSVFLALVKGPANGWAGYLSDCLVYELGDHGKPISMVTLPQTVQGSQFCVRPDGVIWKCQNDTFVKINPSRRAPEMEMGGSDGLSNLAWSRRVQYSEQTAWFHAGKAGDPAAFGETHAFCLPGGGYVSKKDESVYYFPLAAVDLTTGVDSSLVLNVPFEGSFPVPTVNVSHESGNGTESYRALSFHLLAITGLATESRELEITLTTETQTHAVRFDLKDVLQTTETTASKAAGDPMHSARNRAKLVDPKSLNEALQSAAVGADLEYLKALMEVGADPKYVSPFGWTALMTAACYGTADMVDFLIAAGSNVNAADNNCGGQTVLMWAARSGRESRHKIRALLKAGADPKGATASGWNALMSAAGEGELEALECLLQSGMSITTRDNNGETVLMAGARSGKANIIAALLKAGADVKAKDKEGFTALMRAADGYESEGAVEALLKAGANPNARAQDGRTALQIAEKSNHSGSVQVVRLLKPVTTTK